MGIKQKKCIISSQDDFFYFILLNLEAKYEFNSISILVLRILKHIPPSLSPKLISASSSSSPLLSPLSSSSSSSSSSPPSPPSPISILPQSPPWSNWKYNSFVSSTGHSILTNLLGSNFCSKNPEQRWPHCASFYWGLLLRRSLHSVPVKILKAARKYYYNMNDVTPHIQKRFTMAQSCDS